MKELLYKEEVFKLVGYCMEIHRELGKGYDEIIYKDALVVELDRAAIPFAREKKYEVSYKGVILPHFYYADFVVWDKILFEGKAVEKLTAAHVKQVLNYFGCLKTAPRSAGQLRRGFVGVEKDHSLKFVIFREIRVRRPSCRRTPRIRVARVRGRIGERQRRVVDW
jgi:GxxExxY protein